MAIRIPPGFAQATFVMTGPVGTQPYVNTLGVDVSNAGGNFVGVANRLASSWAAHVMLGISSALTLDRVTLQVGQDGGSGSVDSTNPPVGGGSSGEYAPTAMSTIIRKNTAQLGRRFRGRLFLPASVKENNVDPSGYLSADTVTYWDDAFENFFDSLALDTAPGGATTSPVLLHSTRAGVVPTPTPIESFSCAPLVGWIRGRIR